MANLQFIIFVLLWLEGTLILFSTKAEVDIPEVFRHANERLTFITPYHKAL